MGVAGVRSSENGKAWCRKMVFILCGKVVEGVCVCGCVEKCGKCVVVCVCVVCGMVSPSPCPSPLCPKCGEEASAG